MSLLPLSIRQKIGQKVFGYGQLFSLQENIREQEFKVLNVRRSDATIEISESEKFNAFELLLQSEDKNRARWTRPLPIRSEPIK